jgi:hypothetical protein
MLAVVKGKREGVLGTRSGSYRIVTVSGGRHRGPGETDRLIKVNGCLAEGRARPNYLEASALGS